MSPAGAGPTSPGDLVAPGYWDVEGAWHPNDPEAEAVVRGVLGCGRMTGTSGRGMPLVVWGDGPIELTLTSDGSRPDEGLATLSLEDGAIHHFDIAGTSVLTIEGPHPTGYHRLSLSLGHPVDRVELDVIVAPDKVAGPAPGERHWGVFAPLYSVTHDDGSAPTLTDLDRIGALVATLGGSVVGTLPLLATFRGEHGEPDAPSPYTPVSRRFWNEGFTDPALAVDDISDVPGLGDIDAAEVAGADTAYAAFRLGGPGDAARHLAAQRAVRHQLGRLVERFRSRGQRLYLDLPLGTHPDGFDIHEQPGLFATGVSVGAPPDVFFDRGQNWGFPPSQPLDPDCVWHFRDVVRTHMRVAGVLRVDHVMGLFRLYWVPESFDARHGVYVHYPFDALLAVLAVESHRHDCWVVGEDLGTVPDEVRDAMHRRGLLGMWVAEFEHDAWWGGRPLEPPADCVACIDTHDTPTFAAWLADAVDGSELDAIATHAGIVRALGESQAAIVLVNLDDLWGVTEPQNIPGTPADRPNWVHRFPVTLEAMADDARVTGVLHDLDAARKERPDA